MSSDSRQKSCEDRNYPHRSCCTGNCQDCAAVRVEGKPHLYELSLKDVPQEGADVTIQATSYGTDKDTLMIRFDTRTVQTEALDNDPQVTIHTRLPRELLLSHVGTRSINYMIRISQGNGEMGEAQVYLITH